MVSAVLFDADGVIQRPSQDWWARLSSLIPPPRAPPTRIFDTDAFVPI